MLSAADLSAADAAITHLRQKLPLLISLTADDRAKLLDGRLALDEDPHTLMEDHPTLVPGYVDQAELEKDRTLRLQLDGLRLGVKALLDDIERTEMLQAYLGFYSNAKEAEKRRVPAAKTVVEELAKYFSRPARPAPAVAAPES